MPGFIILIICSNESFCLSVTEVHGSSKNFNWDSDFHSKLEFCGIPTYDELSIYVSEIDLINEPFSIAYPLVSDTVSEQAYETLKRILNGATCILAYLQAYKPEKALDFPIRSFLLFK